MTFHTVMTIASGSVDVVCARLYSDQDEAWTGERRITAVKIGNVISQ